MGPLDLLIFNGDHARSTVDDITLQTSEIVSFLLLIHASFNNTALITFLFLLEGRCQLHLDLSGQCCSCWLRRQQAFATEGKSRPEFIAGPATLFKVIAIIVDSCFICLTKEHH